MNRCDRVSEEAFTKFLASTWHNRISCPSRAPSLCLLQYEAVKAARREAELQAAAQQAGKAPLSPLFTVRGAAQLWRPPLRLLLTLSRPPATISQAQAKKPTVAQRIGLHQ